MGTYTVAVTDRKTGKQRIVPVLADSETEAHRLAGAFGSPIGVVGRPDHLGAPTGYTVDIIDRQTGVERSVDLVAESEDEAARMAGDYGVVGRVRRALAGPADPSPLPPTMALTDADWQRLEAVIARSLARTPTADNTNWRKLQNTIAWGVVGGLIRYMLIMFLVSVAAWLMVLLVLAALAASQRGP